MGRKKARRVQQTYRDTYVTCQYTESLKAWGQHHVPWEWAVAVPWVALTNLWFYRRRNLVSIMIVHGGTNAALLLLAVFGDGWFTDADGSPLSLWFFV